MVLGLFSSPYITNFDNIASSGSTRAQDSRDLYDYIIVGGGTAGCVLAAGLSEVSTVRVLLLEAGGSGKSVLLSMLPSGFTMIFHNKAYDYDFWTTTQPNAGNVEKFWPRGKMLGGCSSINAQMAQYGDPGDFDEWAKITGDDSWSWKNFHQSFRKFENYQPDPEQPDINVDLKGSNGPVEVGYSSYFSEGAKAFVKACVAAKIPFSNDFNTQKGSKGVNRIMTYIDSKGKRVSAETAYLTPDVLARPNLHVAIHARVRRTLFEIAGDRQPRAVGVEFASSNDKRYRAYSSKDVILSGGALHSPQILMLSGIGPAEHLKERGISVLHDLSGVGKHLSDHPVLDMNFKDKLGTSLKHIKPKSFWDVLKLLKSVAQYLLTNKGPLTTNVAEAAAFLRTDDPAIYPKEEFTDAIQDSTSTPAGPDIELFFSSVGYRDHGGRTFGIHTLGLHVVLIRPLSEGNLALQSSNYLDSPVINPNYLTSPADVQRLVRGVKLLLRLTKTEPLARFVDLESKDDRLDTDLHSASDKELEDFVRKRLETLYHPSCTCRMAPLKDEGVVDNEMRVYGVHGLRVCDASVFPRIVSGHTAGAVFALAERLSDIIKSTLSVNGKAN